MSPLEKNFLTLPDTMRSSWSAEGSALVAESLRASGCSRLRVRGESMLPALWPGDVVEIASCSPEDVRPGEIVLALRDGRLFLHRLLAPCKPSGFLLRGDSMPGPDPRFPPGAMLGRLVRRVGEERGCQKPGECSRRRANWRPIPPKPLPNAARSRERRRRRERPLPICSKEPMGCQDLECTPYAPAGGASTRSRRVAHQS